MELKFREERNFVLERINQQNFLQLFIQIVVKLGIWTMTLFQSVMTANTLILLVGLF